MTREQFINKWGIVGGGGPTSDARHDLEQDLDELLIDLTPSSESSEGEYIVELNDKWFTVINYT